ncbi:MAG: hypothetical protein NTV00_02890 [Methylococcales bacterium]|nr:hypothetical protein [Methylococcales bacterium]
MTGHITLNLDQQDIINNTLGMLQAVQNLMIPSNDLSLVSRDELSFLLSYFHGRLGDAKDEDEEYRLNNCLGVVIDLTGLNSKEKYLNGVNRENLSILLDYFLNSFNHALKAAL